MTADNSKDYLVDHSHHSLPINLKLIFSYDVWHRVYFNKTADNSKDYLVDHSIIHYLIDPEGEFVTFYGEWKRGKIIQFGPKSKKLC